MRFFEYEARELVRRSGIPVTDYGYTTDAEEAGDQKINALLAAQKEQIDGIIGTAHITSEVAAKALRAIGDKRIKYIAFDDSPAVLAAVKDGFAQATFVQNPYGQAYIGAYALDLIASGQCEMKADAPWIKTPQTAHFISYKLAQRFVADEPPPALVDRMAKLGVANSAGVVLINPRALDVEVKAKVASARPDEKQYLAKFEEIWQALDFAALYLTHWTLLRLPYYWDEAGYYVPTSTLNWSARYLSHRF